MHKRSIAALMAVIMASAVMPVFPVSAETDEPFPYTLFAGSNEDGALTIHADHICVNGSIAANGTITANSDHFNVNGQCIEQADFPMVYAFGKLRDAYFSSDDVITVDTDYTFEDVNIKLNVPVVSAGEVSMNGNIKLRSQLMAERDIHFSGNSCNADNAALILRAKQLKTLSRATKVNLACTTLDM